MSCAPIPPDITIRIERGEYREQGFRVATRLPDGTTAPQSTASGARMSEVLSPTPPVLCLSTGIPCTPG